MKLLWPAVIRKHAWAIGVEDARHPYLNAIHAVVVETEGLGDALALVVATAHTNRIDGAPITLRLGVHLRIPVNLAGAGEQKPCPNPRASPSML